MVEELKCLLISIQCGSNGKIPTETFEKALSEHFPQKQSIEIADLISCAQSISACAGRDVNIASLFDQVDGAYSPFVELLWRQGLHERATFTRFLQVRYLCIF
jgi:hypothetical protein